MKSKKTELLSEKLKTRGLFDHVNHIRETKDPNYYLSLSDLEKKSFNKYMIIRILSMDAAIIEEMAIVSKYFQTMPDNNFYKVLIDLVPRGKRFCKYIKKSSDGLNETILKCICNKFGVGEKDATDYYNILISHDSGLKELLSIVEGFGYNESEMEKIFK